MTYYLATKESIVNWIKGLSSENRTYFPQRHGEVSYRFAPVQSNSDIQFENYTPTVVPPVKYLVPAREELLQFRKGADGKSEVTASLDTSFRILAGVRPCDLKGIYLMDLFFKDGVPDAYYLARRANTAIIAYSCSAACDQRAFCGAVESANHTEGADIFVTPQAGGELLVDVKTDLGQKLASGAGWKPCKEAPDKNLSAQLSGRTFAATVPEITGIIEKKFNSPVWDKHVARCFSCGTCNLVCPTCYCFDVADDLNLDVTTGNRTRTWDGCMLPTFATVVGGHNFRPDPAARQRHRVSRKFDYLPKKYERGSVCVGCGRCGRQCTSHIDIYDIVSDLIQEGGR